MKLLSSSAHALGQDAGQRALQADGDAAGEADEDDQEDRFHLRDLVRPRVVPNGCSHIIDGGDAARPSGAGLEPDACTGPEVG